jgi:hypothetical protein
MLDLALRQLSNGWIMVHLAGETFTLTDYEFTELLSMVNAFTNHGVDEICSKDYGEWQANLHERRRPVDRNDLVELGLLKEKVKEKIERRI